MGGNQGWKNGKTKIETFFFFFFFFSPLFISLHQPFPHRADRLKVIKTKDFIPYE